MSKSPIINSSFALFYIVFVSLIMGYLSKLAKYPDPIIAPVTVISLFTLSAAVMGYLFCFQPIQLYSDGKKKEAVKLFLQTVLIFSGFTFFFLILLFSRLFINY